MGVLHISFLFSISVHVFLINSVVVISSSPAPASAPVEKNIDWELLKAQLVPKLKWPRLDGLTRNFNNPEASFSVRGKPQNPEAGPAQEGEPGPNAIIPTVSTPPLGKVMGKAFKSRSGRFYYAFLGVPYTQNPKRFQPANLIDKFDAPTGVLDARKEGPMCPQPGGADGVQGEENCLFLNIYYPHDDLCQNVTESNKLPVMYNIHGGSFTSGHGSFYDPKYLMDECIVFVSVNYRLGALGFLTTEDGLIPGNLGLKDQVVGLQFVNKYISYFRGDKDSVTVLGISAGGSSASHLVTSPTAKGLIHRAISSSGNVMNPWSIIENPGETAKALGRILNCSTENSTVLKECLERADLKDIILHQSKTPSLIPFGPVIEMASEEHPFQNQNPAVRLQSGDFNRIPLITGFVKDEGIVLFSAPVLSNPRLTYLFNAQWNTFAPAVFQYDQFGFSEEEKNEISRKIRAFYFGDKPISQETRQNLTNLFSDRLFIQGTFETAQLHSKFAPVYSYVLSYEGGFSSAWNYGYRIPAVSHGDDAQFLFSGQDFEYGTEQYDLSAKMVKLWTTFAATGRPMPMSTEGIDFTSQSTSWKVTEGSERSNGVWFDLNFPSQHHNLFNYLERRRSFWENVGIYKKEHY